MKKIITAKEQWTNDVNASYEKYGEFDNISYHKIEDDGFGIINDNEMYHFDEGGQDDVFYIKVGDTFSKVVCPVSSNVLVANNYRKIDLDAAWIDIYKLMEWLHVSDIDGNYEEEVESFLNVQMYQIVWMGVYSSECTETKYQDIEVEVEGISEVKQTFLQQAEQNAHYVDEVAGIAYWYNENFEDALLYIGDDTNKDYRYATFAPFATMSANEFKAYLDYVVKTFDVKDEKFTFDSMNVWRANGDINDYQYLSYYCDFIMQGGRNPKSTNKIESPKQTSATNVNSYAEQIALIKKRLLSDIEDAFNCLECEKVNIYPTRMWNYCVRYELLYKDGILAIMGYDAENNCRKYRNVKDFEVENLVHIYSQTHI